MFYITGIFAFFQFIATIIMIWRHRLTERTRDFQSRNRSSILRGAIELCKIILKSAGLLTS